MSRQWPTNVAIPGSIEGSEWVPSVHVLLNKVHRLLTTQQQSQHDIRRPIVIRLPVKELFVKMSSILFLKIFFY